MSRRGDLVNDLCLACEQVKGVVHATNKGLAVAYRAMGERLIVFANTSAARDGRKFSDMTEMERQGYRDTVEGINRKTLDEIGQELVDRGFDGLGISGTSLYNAMRIAVAYSDREIKKYLERGASLQKLIYAASLESSRDRDRVLSEENVKASFDDFRLLVEEAGNGGGGLKPAAVAGKKAAQTKKEAKKEAKSRERKEKPSKAPGGTDRLDRMLSKLSDHLDDRLLGQMADIPVVWDRDYKDLSAEDKVTVASEVDRLEPLLLTLAATLRMIYACAITNDIIPESRLTQVREELAKAIA